MRADERRAEKLADIRAQIAAGKLTVRQMTPDERALQPAQPPKAAGPGRRSRGRG